MLFVYVLLVKLFVYIFSSCYHYWWM